MAKELLINQTLAECRAALTENGEIIDKDSTIFSGKQNSSIIHHLDILPKVAFNRNTKQIAIASDNKVDILTV